MPKIIFFLAFCLLSTQTLATDYFTLYTRDFKAKFYPAYGDDAEKVQQRMTHIRAILADDNSSKRPGLMYDGSVIGYDPNKFLVLKIEAFHGAQIFLLARVGIPKECLPLKDGTSFIFPQPDIGFSLISYDKGILRVTRALDPKDKYDFFRRFQNDFKIEISPDLLRLRSIEWQNYDVKKIKTPVLGIHLLDRKEMVAKISASFKSVAEASPDARE